jgi:hypothetical protein
MASLITCGFSAFLCMYSTRSLHNLRRRESSEASDKFSFFNLSASDCDSFFGLSGSECELRSVWKPGEDLAWSRSSSDELLLLLLLLLLGEQSRMFLGWDLTGRRCICPRQCFLPLWNSSLRNSHLSGTIFRNPCHSITIINSAGWIRSTAMQTDNQAERISEESPIAMIRSFRFPPGTGASKSDEQTMACDGRE